MNRNISLIAGIVTGFAALMVMTQFASLSIDKSDFVIFAIVLLAFASVASLLRDTGKTKRCIQKTKPAIKRTTTHR